MGSLKSPMQDFISVLVANSDHIALDCLVSKSRFVRILATGRQTNKQADGQPQRVKPPSSSRPAA